MAQRLYMTRNPPRLITSKPGHNATPELPETLKTFDSNWFNGCGIRWIFNASVARPSQLGATVMFPYALNHVPRCIIMFGWYSTGSPRPYPIPGFTWPVAPYGPFFFTSWQESMRNCRVYSDRVYVQPSFNGGGETYTYKILVLQS